MSEELNVSSSDNQGQVPDTLGQILRAAREAKNLSVADVATALHLRPSIVNNIEADDFSNIANATYIRGYVKNFARIVEADKQKVARCLEQQAPVVTEPTMQSFSRKTVRQARDTRYHFVTWLVLIGLLVAMVIWWLQTSKFFNNASVDFSKPTAEEVAAQQSVPVSARLPQVQPKPDNGNDTASQTTDGAAAVEGIAVDASGMDAGTVELPQTQAIEPAATDTQASGTEAVTQVGAVTGSDTQANTDDAAPQTAAEILAADAELRAPKQAQQVSEPTPAAEDGLEGLVVKFSADCWIQVKDGNGKVLVSEVRKPGQDLNLSGKAPLSLILGAPGAVNISFNGQAVSLDEFPKGKVARFNLPRNG